jgi:transcriptional regulator with XRE-family HTH domain
MNNPQVKNSLKKLREAKNLTQEQLSEISGVARPVISEFENGKRRPSPRTIGKLAEALGCDYIKLLTGKDEIEAQKRPISEQERQEFLKEAGILTSDYCREQNLQDALLLMNISGHLGQIIEQYEAVNKDEQKRILADIKEQKSRRIALDIFLKRKFNQPK